MSRQLNLNAFLMSTGHHEASWRLPESDPYAAANVAHYQELARIAERGRLDSVFFADSPSLFSNPARRPAETLEPTLLLAAMAVVTERIGLVATASTTYEAPYNLARRFASLDAISNGRAGWNVVTTAALDAGRELRLRDLADARRAVRPGQRVPRGRDRSLGRLGGRRRRRRQGAGRAHGPGPDPRRSTTAAEHFQVRGPLTVGRSPQGRPVIVQAGSSGPGIALAAAYAEAVFTAQRTLEEGQAFYRELKAATAAAGRNPEHVKILPGIVPIIGDTEEEALAMERQLDELLVHEHAAAAAVRRHRHPGRRDRPRRAAARGHPAAERHPGQPDPLRAHRRLRAPRQPHRAADPVAARRRARSPDAGRHRRSRSRTRSRSGSPTARPTAST